MAPAAGTGRWNRWLAGLFASLETQNRRRLARDQQPAVTIAFRAAAIVTMALVIAFITTSTLVYIQWPPAAYSDPRVLNLTSHGVKWDTYYGDFNECDGRDCRLIPGAPAELFQQQLVLPTRNFPQREVKPGDLIYYRAKLLLPPVLAETQEPLVLHSIWIYAESYSIYINGVLVDRGGQKLLHAVIPPGLLKPGVETEIAIKIDPGQLVYGGINHYGAVVLGPASVLADVVNIARDIKNTFNLFHLLPRLTASLIFAFVFLVLTRNVENFAFVCYTALSAAAIFMVTELPGASYVSGPAPELRMLLLMCFASWLLFVVIEQYFRQSKRSFWLFFWAAGLALGGLTVWTEITNDTTLAAVVNAHVARAMRLGSAAYGFGLAAATALYLRRSGLSRFRFHTSVIMAGFFLMSAGLYVLDFAELIPARYASSSLLLHDTLLTVLLAGLLAIDYGQTVNQRDLVTRKFRTFVDSKVADRILRKGGDVKPQVQEMTVMFCDIRNFTVYAEGHPVESVFAFLNEYLRAMVEVIDAHGGVIDKFAGDGIMAVWGSPEPMPDHALAAARCAVAMRGAMRGLNQRLAAAGEPAFAIGIGLHSGLAMSGPLGTERRTEFTVIGDTVNTAARMESLTKECGHDIVISDAVLQRIAGQADCVSFGPRQLKGKTAPMMVHGLSGVRMADGVLETAGGPPPSAAGGRLETVAPPAIKLSA